MMAGGQSQVFAPPGPVVHLDFMISFQQRTGSTVFYISQGSSANIQATNIIFSINVLNTAL
jgi:hypothetical protein